jgi:hypothetical protein
MVFSYSPPPINEAEMDRIARADYDERDQTGLEDQAAHAPGGKTCEKCGQPISARQEARRRGESGWVHDVCPD